MLEDCESKKPPLFILAERALDSQAPATLDLLWLQALGLAAGAAEFFH